ncbi:MAG TPA: alpha-2-macroglobulin family protein, partial [Pirellulales bacterium]|nr:alpha-2-macroglobulin family protein [Pirellulales bacterium]
PDDAAKETTSAPTHGPRAIAERLVYRKPDRRLQIRVADHAEKYAPGDKVALSLLALKETGEPAKSAVFGCAVVDDSLLKLADDDSAATPTHFYLTSEIEKPEDLEKADFYLSDDPQADLTLDLLLGTQGWRRFVEQSLDELQQKSKEAGQPAAPSPPVQRLLAMGGAALPPTVLDNLDKVRAEYDVARAEAEADYRAAAAQLRRAAILGGLIVAGLLIAVNVAPYLGKWREWNWRAAAPRFGPALAAAALCIVAGLLWNPVGWDLPQSNLVALEEFKLRPIALPSPVGDALLGLKFTGQSGRVHLNEAKNYWYFGRGEQLGIQNWDKQAGMHYNFAFTDMYGFGAGQRALGVWADDMAVNYLPRFVRPELSLDRWDVSGQAGLSRQLEAAWIDAGRMVRFDERLGDSFDALAISVDGRRILTFGNRPAIRLWDASGSMDYDSDQLDMYAKLLKQQVEQFRFPVREYAHQHVTSADGVRSDFAETLFWHPLLVTDENGRATIEFDLSDSVTSYRVLTDAHDGTGRIGTGDGELVARLPFTVEPKIPLEVNAGDRIELPVAVSNDSAAALETMLGCEITDKKESASSEQDGTPSAPAALPLLKLADTAEQRLAVAAGDRARAYFAIDVVGQKGEAEVEVRGKAEAHGDAKRQSVRVVPPGFPVGQSYAGRIEGQQEVTINLPESVIPGTLEVTLAAYPSTIASIQSGLDGILREPSGCFEQTSSSNYPNLLLLRYLEENDVSRPELARRGKELLSAGYAKLTGYECKSGGFEWFGADPGHEALTAYGLLEFRDMAKIHTVDPALLDRTANWLMGRRDGKGG